MDAQQLLERQSFIELDARSRAKKLLDEGTFTELLDPFERVTSPWLARQNIVTQSDDGAVVAKGTIDGQPAVVLGIDGGFQGGSMGEVSAAKIAGSLELAAEDNRNGIPTRAVILFETGGVRLQEANLGLAGIADIHAAIVDLRRYQPVIGITAGPIGCYGGMSIAAGLCSYLIGTREARLGLNGPAVIEQEAGIAEFDSRDRPTIWSFTGCEQRHRTGLIDVFTADDADAIRAAVIDLLRAGRPAACRSERVAGFIERLDQIDTAAQATPQQAAAIFGKGFAS
ncbi:MULTISPECIES: biotin-independent malonate decarboxylase subunit beta [unclassified Caballeronia]|uniref:biotin-independent malonate decarboxylase subunit beta n=1 Tax=unclassified Caballeronia TaxID=2646786 RepID=UPI0028674846|nr:MULTISPECIES: biotin-independent malonate decarboxylase subunit beta [unclassified Caballeronia]MDR5740949.1 biotin-independent malonate decarboxylase subunit beta [Caballeronia sp. LZ016]MDR5806847.1 biotin-independent malonate decarboxylase subunit beta [Caballeronia sp. LZ019]